MICHSAFSSLSGRLGPSLRYPTSLDWDVSCMRDCEAGGTRLLCWTNLSPTETPFGRDSPALSVELHLRHHGRWCGALKYVYSALLIESLLDTYRSLVTTPLSSSILGLCSSQTTNFSHAAQKDKQSHELHATISLTVGASSLADCRAIGSPPLRGHYDEITIKYSLLHYYLSICTPVLAWQIPRIYLIEK